MRQYTITEAVAELGLKRRTVQKWARVLGCRRHGRAFVLTDEDLRMIRDANHSGGRPTHR